MCTLADRVKKLADDLEADSNRVTFKQLSDLIVELHSLALVLFGSSMPVQRLRPVDSMPTLFENLCDDPS